MSTSQLLRPRLTTITLDKTRFDVPQKTPLAGSPSALNLGLLPIFAVVAALGVLTVAIADSGARSGATWSMGLFWIGMLGIFIPITGYLVVSDPSRGERIGLVAILATALYTVKVMNSPLGFTYHDEFLHWATTIDILRFHRLFTSNPLLPVSPLYPGLESITAALASMSGLSIFSCGIIVVGAARLLLVLSLFLVYEHVSGSATVASIASAIYMANPNFIFFDAQFAYESLALPLSVFAICILLTHAWDKQSMRSSATWLALISIAAVVVTHHATSYALLMMFAIWSLVPSVLVGATRLGITSRNETGRLSHSWTFIECRIPSSPLPVMRARLHRRNRLELWVVGVTALMIAGWIVGVARLTVSYLAPIVTSTESQVVHLLVGGSQERGLFQASAGPVPPAWERIVAYLAVVIVLVGLPVGFVEVWRHFRSNAFAIVLAVVAFSYVALLPLHFTESGLILANRSAGFVFFGVAIVLGLTVTATQVQHVFPWRSLATVGLLAVMFVGMLSVGRPPWMRLPGPFLVEAEPRSIQPEGIQAADWMKAVLGPDHRVLTDRTNRLLMATYGEQHPISGISDDLNTGEVFFSPTFGAHEQWVLDQVNAQYVIVDRRLADGLPLSGYYFDPGESGANHHITPIPASSLSKFDQVSSMSRVYASGNIVIYLSTDQ